MLIGGRYRLSQPIGRGRSGFVWIAQDTRVQRTVTAKPIAPSRASSFALAANAMALAVQHARHATELKHPSAVSVYDVVVDVNGVWLIMEYVPARTMSDFLAGHGKLDPADVVSLGIQLAAALAAAHEIGLLHRAVEPANVLLADDGGVQITDFGTGMMQPDPAYRAPELITGGVPTRASDVFSLGATLFYAVEGVTPFGPHGTDPGPPLTRTPEFSGTLFPTASPASSTPAAALSHVLLRMLSADPALRPTMPGIWQALKAISDGGQPTPAALAAPASAVETPHAAPAAAQTPYAPPAPTQAAETAPPPEPLAAKPTVAGPPRPAIAAQAPEVSPQLATQPTWPAMTPPRVAQALGAPAVASSKPSRLLIVVALLIAATVGILFTELVFL